MLPLRLQTMLLQLQAMPLHIVANNTNTTIITNTANIIDLKKWVDIDGNGSDADLTSWDVSHVTDASRAKALPATVIALFAAVMATLECFPPKLGVVITVY
jgi:hypothetical protein